jgi:Tfp pilus assembly protein PilP
MMRLVLLVVAAALLQGTSVGGQAPPPAPAPVAPAATTTATKVPPLEPQGYDYDPAGRRDPFVSLVRRTTAASGTSATSRPRGLAGLSTDEITMRGVVKGRDGFVAMAIGGDNRIYYLKAGDELYDGVIRAVTAEAMFVMQNVNDPLSTVRKREVRKPLRPAQEAH